MKKQKGFTLIELLVVIAIIGILSSVVLASLNSARESSRDARRLSDLRQFQVALELYFDDNAAYPATLDDLTPTYISATSLDPLDAAYIYAASGSPATSYVLGANLEDDSHNALDNDVDGTQAGSVDCDDTGNPDYCIIP